MDKEAIPVDQFIGSPVENGVDFFCGVTDCSMGNASQIALGIAKAQPSRSVHCLDNAAHDSVGGQPTVGGAVDLKAIVRACGYDVCDDLTQRHRVTESSTEPPCRSVNKPRFVEIRVAKGAHKDLGRPKEPPQVNKKLFMATLGIVD